MRVRSASLACLPQHPLHVCRALPLDADEQRTPTQQHTTPHEPWQLQVRSQGGTWDCAGALLGANCVLCARTRVQCRRAVWLYVPGLVVLTSAQHVLRKFECQLVCGWLVCRNQSMHARPPMGVRVEPRGHGKALLCAFSLTHVSFGVGHRTHTCIVMHVPSRTHMRPLACLSSHTWLAHE